MGKAWAVNDEVRQAILLDYARTEAFFLAQPRTPVVVQVLADLRW
jgi:hypothetical protein